MKMLFLFLACLSCFADTNAPIKVLSARMIYLVRTNHPATNAVIYVGAVGFPPLPPVPADYIQTSPPLPKGTNLSYSSTIAMTNFYNRATRK